MNPAILTRLREECRRLIADNPELAEDADLRADMIEGETILADVLHSLERVEAEARSDCSKLNFMRGQIDARFEAAARRSKQARKAIMQVLDVAGLAKFSLPQATLSVSRGPQKVIEMTRDECPETFRKHSWSPDISAIGDALKAGEHVPGFVLSNPEPVLRIR